MVFVAGQKLRVSDLAGLDFGCSSGRVVRLQSGYLYTYAFVMLIGVAALLTWVMVTGGFR